MQRTHYDWLEIAENASPEVIRGAFKYLAQKNHPDKNRQNRELAESRLREITAAFKVLSNPEARAKYDRWLKRQRFSNPNFERRRSRTAKKYKETRSTGEKRSTSTKRVDTWV
ncbi:MAG: DnaJ domain-containing protein [Pseudomonadota bacterium]